MNLNQMIKVIKDELGLTKFIKTSYDDHAIYKILKTNTIPTFSKYYAAQYQAPIFTLTELTQISNNSAYYKIPEYVTKPLFDIGSEIMAIKEYEIYENLGYNPSYKYINTEALALSDIELFSGLEDMALYGERQNYYNYKYTMYYEKPDLFRVLFNRLEMQHIEAKLLYANVTFWVKHTEDLFTLSQTMEYLFYRLAKLDVMITIYNNEAKFVESVSTGIGNLNLKIDDWATAQQQKDELLNEFKANSTWFNMSMKTF